MPFISTRGVFPIRSSKLLVANQEFLLVPMPGSVCSGTIPCEGPFVAEESRKRNYCPARRVYLAGTLMARDPRSNPKRANGPWMRDAKTLKTAHNNNNSH